MRRFFSVVLLFSFLFLIAFPVLAEEVSYPGEWFDDGAIADNEGYAIDSNFGTAANITGASGNLSYYNFTKGPGAIGKIILTLHSFTEGFVDDLWGLAWSRDNGTTWTELEPLSSTNDPFPDGAYIYELDSLGVPFTWEEIRQNLTVQHSFVVVGGADLAGYTITEEYLNITLDTRGPHIDLFLPVNGENISTTSVNLTFNASDDYSGVGNCSLYIDGQYNQSNTSVVDSTETRFSVPFPEGTHTWVINCTDGSEIGNSNISLTRTLTIDFTAPNVTLVSPQNATPYADGSPVMLSYNFTDISATASCKLFLNGELNQTAVAWSGMLQYFLVYLENGLYDWQLNCTDPFGQSGVSQLWLLNVSNNEAPIIPNMTIDKNLSLTLGSFAHLWCNATIIDAASGDIQNATARIRWKGYVGVDEPSVQYTNTSCALFPYNATSREAKCSFGLSAMARAGVWECEILSADTGGLFGSGTIDFSVDPLYAFNISPGYISYGGYLPGTTTDDRSITITNMGNTRIDVTLDGFAVTDGDGLAMDCDIGNITLDQERYSLSSGTPFNSMTSLTDDAVDLVSFDLEPSNETFSSQRPIYWKVALPIPLNGTCAGFVTVTAIPG